MATYIEVDGERVLVPAKVLAAGPAAVAKFLKKDKAPKATTDDGKG